MTWKKPHTSRRKSPYHGTPYLFDKFEYSKIGQTGTGAGKGFYFTNDFQTALGYSGGSAQMGHVIEADLDIKKPLSLKTHEITKPQFRKFLRALDPDCDGFLSNWGNAEDEGYKNVIEKAVVGEYDNSDNDVDLINSVINGGGGEKTFKVLRDTLGYDGIIIPISDNVTHYIVFSDDQIKNRHYVLGGPGNYTGHLNVAAASLISGEADRVISTYKPANHIATAQSYLGAIAISESEHLPIYASIRDGFPEWFYVKVPDGRYLSPLGYDNPTKPYYHLVPLTPEIASKIDRPPNELITRVREALHSESTS